MKSYNFLGNMNYLNFRDLWAQQFQNCLAISLTARSYHCLFKHYEITKLSLFFNLPSLLNLRYDINNLNSISYYTYTSQGNTDNINHGIFILQRLTNTVQREHCYILIKDDVILTSSFKKLNDVTNRNRAFYIYRRFISIYMWNNFGASLLKLTLSSR